MAPQQSTASPPRASSPANNSHLTTVGAADNNEVSHRKRLEDLGYGVESFNTILRPGKTSSKYWNRVNIVGFHVSLFLFAHFFSFFGHFSVY